MLYGEKSREDLCKYALGLFQKVNKPALRRKLYNDLFEKFNMSASRADEMITLKRDINEFTPFEVFCVAYFLDKSCLSRFFTAEEIKNLSEEKFVDETIDFPIIFNNMAQVTDTQWIGVISVQKLMQLKKARLINYEEGEQRALKRVKSGKTEIYKPYVNYKSVRDIKKAMENGEYIPDPITLNMPEGSEYSFENGNVTVYSLPKGMFNLDDGYHRYIAMSQIYDFNPEFDYPMEFRLVNFSKAKANVFIWQQDQKTLMRKVVSDTYNKNTIQNKISQRLNQDPGCNIQGMIGLNGAKIDEAFFNALISYFFVPSDIKKEEEMRTIISITNNLRDKFNAVTSQNDIFLGKYTNELLFTTMFVFSTQVEPGTYADKILSIVNSLSEEDRKMMNVTSAGNVRIKAINILKDKM